MPKGPASRKNGTSPAAAAKKNDIIRLGSKGVPPPPQSKHATAVQRKLAMTGEKTRAKTPHNLQNGLLLYAYTITLPNCTIYLRWSNHVISRTIHLRDHTYTQRHSPSKKKRSARLLSFPTSSLLSSLACIGCTHRYTS